MDIDSYIKDHFDDFVGDFGETKGVKNIHKNTSKNIVIDTVDDDCYYSREEIYGDFDEDDDSIEENEYSGLETVFTEKKDFEENYNIMTKKNEDDYDDIKYDEYMEKMISSADKKKEEEDEEDKFDDTDINNLMETMDKIKKNTETNAESSQFVNMFNDPEVKTIKINKNKNVKFSDVNDIDEIEDINEIEQVEEIEAVNDADDKGEYMLSLINLFMIHFNNKYGKNNNFMTGIKNNEVDTNNQMEMFMTSMTEYEYIKERIFDNKKERFYFENKEFVSHYLDDDDIEKFYTLVLFDDNKVELKRIYSPSLFDCLNFLYENIDNPVVVKNNWNIFDLK